MASLSLYLPLPSRCTCHRLVSPPPPTPNFPYTPFCTKPLQASLNPYLSLGPGPRPRPGPRLRLTRHPESSRATLDDEAQISGSTTPSVRVQDQNPASNKGVVECVKVLKNAAKTRKVPPEEILQAFSVIEKAKLDPSGFLQTLGGTESPGRTWMLIFTAQKKLNGGKYFPITAVQRFDAAGKRIENGVYMGPLGSLTFEGRISWNTRILAFIFERIRIKIGPLDPFEYCFKGKEEREPSNKDPFFIWFYVDEEIAVARGRSGGTAFWVRCQQLAN